MTNTSGGLVADECTTPKLLLSGAIWPLDAPVIVVSFVRAPPSTLTAYR
jgi:hypothetical protein